ncbi:ABC transporter ATP-binding protein [Vibrio ziniensis]|uniref:ABC transporter ATP-binding protein n=1 Tax=Vibrio ziniensis TaxID=2711221 RepID=A0A6G7CNL7_9VIBR|nr:ATP-binding cassette domain-containing protein [Vibrio ziniensis]QIH43727.1 ABC transporter ATP-binding protein [Vibrio ziniensis]
MSELLRISNLNIAVGERPLLENVSLVVKKGEPLVILGQTGSGKSLLMKWIMASIDSSLNCNGDISIHGEAVNMAQRRTLWGSQMAMLPQEPMTTLDPLMKSGEQVAEVSRFVLGFSKHQARFMAQQELERYGLAHTYQKRVGQLSGGMAQRMAICVSTAANASIILADEPTKGLDVNRRDDVVDMLRDKTKDDGLIVVTHDVDVALRLGGQILVLHYGKVVEQGQTLQVLANPQQEYTQELIRSTPKNWSKSRCEKGTQSRILRVENLSIERGKQKLFESLSFDVQQGEIVGIVGDSGCGKSSLGDAILGHLKASSGEIDRQKTQGKAKWLKLYQDPFTSLAQHLTLGKMLDDLIALHKLDASRVAPLMEKLALREQVLTYNSSQVSGGELQRFSILRALMMDPVFLFADEPTSRLDPIIAKEVTMQLAQLAREQNCGLLIVSHDPDLIDAIADKVINISDYVPQTVSLQESIA